MPPSSFVPEPGETIAGHYHLDALLGVGGAGEVMRATDTDTGDVVAVKFIRGLDAAMDLRFPTEVAVLQRLDHPSIVRLLDHGHHAEMPYLVMEYVDGASVAKMLVDGPLEPSEVTRIGAQVAAALSHAHHQAVVHRDVKPGNVLVGTDGAAKLADFGIARIAGVSVHTRTGEVLGSAVYLAPEQARGEAVGPAADVFSLGLVLAEAVTGELGPAATPAEILMQRASGHVPELGDLPSAIRELVTTMTRPDPHERPTAADVARALAAFGATPVDVAGPPAPVVESPARATKPPPAPGPRSADATTTRNHPAPRPGARLTPQGQRYLMWALLVAAGLLLVLAGLALGSGGEGETGGPPSTTAPVGPPPTDPGP